MPPKRASSVPLGGSGSSSSANADPLDPSFDPGSVNMSRLRGILFEHDVPIPGNARKADLVRAFEEHVRPRANEINVTKANVQPSSKGIEIIGEEPPTPKRTKRKSTATAPAPAPTTSASTSTATATTRRDPESSKTPRKSIGSIEEEEEEDDDMQLDAPFPSSSRKRKSYTIYKGDTDSDLEDKDKDTGKPRSKSARHNKKPRRLEFSDDDDDLNDVTMARRPRPSSKPASSSKTRDSVIPLKDAEEDESDDDDFERRMTTLREREDRKARRSSAFSDFNPFQSGGEEEISPPSPRRKTIHRKPLTQDFDTSFDPGSLVPENQQVLPSPQKQHAAPSEQLLSPPAQIKEPRSPRSSKPSTSRIQPSQSSPSFKPYMAPIDKIKRTSSDLNLEKNRPSTGGTPARPPTSKLAHQISPKQAQQPQQPQPQPQPQPQENVQQHRPQQQPQQHRHAPRQTQQPQPQPQPQPQRQENVQQHRPQQQQQQSLPQPVKRSRKSAPPPVVLSQSVAPHVSKNGIVDSVGNWSWYNLAIPIGIFFFAYFVWFQYESNLLGYCDTGSDSNAVQDSRGPLRLPFVSETPEPIVSILDTFEDIGFRPSCKPCPSHAVCTASNMRCQSDYVLRRGWFGFGQVKCVPDTEKMRRISAQAKLIGRELSQHRGQIICDGKLPRRSENLEEWKKFGLAEENLRKSLYSRKRKSEKLSDELWNESFDLAIQDLLTNGEIAMGINPNDGETYLAAKQAEFPFLCRLRLQAWETIYQNKLNLFLFISIVFGVIYVRFKLRQRAKEKEKIKEIVAKVFYELRQQELRHHADPVIWTQPYISPTNLRDEILAEYPPNARRSLWRKIEAVIQGNSNIRVRTGELRGEETIVWEWIGAIGYSEWDDSPRRSSFGGRKSFGGADLGPRPSGTPPPGWSEQYQDGERSVSASPVAYPQLSKT